MIITEAEAKDMLIQEMRENERLHAEIARLKAERDILQKDKGDWYSDKLHAVTVNANLGVEIARLRQQLATAKKVLQYAIECDEAIQPTIYYESRLMWRSHQLAEIVDRAKTVLKELGGDE